MPTNEEAPELHHVGSTSVPGMSATAVIDVEPVATQPWSRRARPTKWPLVLDIYERMFRAHGLLP